MKTKQQLVYDLTRNQVEWENVMRGLVICPKDQEQRICCELTELNMEKDRLLSDIAKTKE